MVSYLQVENLTKSYGENVLFENISFAVNKDEKVALIAKNGAGKTSLLNIINNTDQPDSGKVTFRKDISVGYLPQEPTYNPQLTVLEQVFDSAKEIVTVIREYESAVATHNKELLEATSHKMDFYNAWDYESKIKLILTQLKVLNFEQPMNELSGGQRKRVALANLLINEPDLIILDEPTNHLDLDMIEWLEEYIQKSKCTLLMVTHDRYFLDRICDHIFEIDNNTIYRYNGNYSYYLEKREERIQNLSANIQKASNLLKTELDWIRRMPKARGTKAKYRIDNFYKIKEQASQRIDDKQIQFNIQTRRLGTKVADLYNITKSFENQLIVKDFSYKFARYEKIGIVGANGSGKTTFLNLITGNLPLDSGIIEIGETVVFGYYTQLGIQFDENQRVIDIIKDISEDIHLSDGSRLSPSQFLENFLFPSAMQYSYVYKLSGGERRRLYLMTVLMRNPNFLVLDEPTNDLDIMTLNVLENYIQNFKGNILIVSHDRYFMDKVCDNLLVFDGNGEVKSFPSCYSDYSAYKADLEREAKKTEKEIKPEKEKPIKQNVRKLSFKEKKEIEQLENDLEQLNNEKAAIENELNYGTLNSIDLLTKTKRFEEIINLIEEKEFRWLELSELA